jgi:chromosome-anchoring protein RacA
MSTAAVAKLLGVSRRTLMRWVSQLDMQLEKNELGHYQFTEDDIERLKQIQNQPNMQLHSSPSHSDETGNKVSAAEDSKVEDSKVEDSKVESLNARIDELERKMRGKAEDVVSYQLLQHRREMEELVKKISKLEQKIEKLVESDQPQSESKENLLVFDPSPSSKKPKRKGIISSLFSL